MFPPLSYSEPHDRVVAKCSLMSSRCSELLSRFNGVLAEIFDDLMNYVLILQLRLMGSETFIFSLKGRCREVELFNSVSLPSELLSYALEKSLYRERICMRKASLGSIALTSLP